MDGNNVMMLGLKPAEGSIGGKRTCHDAGSETGNGLGGNVMMLGLKLAKG